MQEELNNLDLHDCEFKEIGEDTYEYRYVPAWVTIVKNSDNENTDFRQIKELFRAGTIE